MSEMIMVEKYPQNKRSSVAIKPFFDSNIDNMGLQKYGLSLFEGAFHEEQIACLEQNGLRRYVTGLNEFAPEIRELDADEQEAKIKQIRTVVAQLEKELTSNTVKVDDPDFWNKVKTVRPDNYEFWDKIKIRCSNEPVYLDPATDPYDLIRLYALEAGGFSIVAKSMDHARKMASPPKFYLDKLEETASANTEVKKLRNRAASFLQTLFDKDNNKLFYIAKSLDPNSAQYKKSTPNDIIYDNMDKYISGETTERNKKVAATRFIEHANMSMEDLKIKAIVKDSSYFKFIATKADGYIYHMQENVMLGRNVADVIEYLKNPLNESILVDLIKKTEKYWNQ